MCDVCTEMDETYSPLANSIFITPQLAYEVPISSSNKSPLMNACASASSVEDGD